MADKKISALTAASTPLGGAEVLPIVQSGSTVKVSVANLTAGRAMSALSGTFGSGTSAYSISGTQVSLTNTSANTYLSVYGGSGSTNGGFLLGGNNTENQANIFWSNGSNYLQIAANPASSKIKLYAAGVDIGDFTTNGYAPTAAKGINFTANTPAAGMTSQLLNWYEEGTWTPVPTASSGAITSYTSSGRYTRIGRSVVLSFNITITNNGTGAGVLFATGMPYAANAVNLESGVIAEVAVVGFSGYTVFNTTTKLSMGKYDNTYPGGTNHVIVGQITYQV